MFHWVLWKKCSIKSLLEHCSTRDLVEHCFNKTQWNTVLTEPWSNLSLGYPAKHSFKLFKDRYCIATELRYFSSELWVLIYEATLITVLCITNVFVNISRWHGNTKTSWYNKRGSWLWNMLRFLLMYVHMIWMIKP